MMGNLKQIHAFRSLSGHQQQYNKNQGKMPPKPQAPVFYIVYTLYINFHLFY